MFIYSSLRGLDAAVNGGKCRGVIIYYYSHPFSSLLRRTHTIFCTFIPKDQKSLVYLAKSIPWKLTDVTLNTFKNVELLHAFTGSNTHMDKHACTPGLQCCCCIVMERQQQGFQSAHMRARTHLTVPAYEERKIQRGGGVAHVVSCTWTFLM